MNSFLKVFYLFIWAALPSGLYSQDSISNSADLLCDSCVRFLFTGDVMQHGPQIAAAWDSLSGAYVYDSCFSVVSPYFKKYDYVIANLEFTLGGKPFTGYPQFSAPDEIAVALKNAGVNILATANNHSCDRGLKGVSRTIAVLDSIKIKHTGTFMDIGARDTLAPLIFSHNGINIAILNYTYGTNGIAIPEPSLVDITDTAIIRSDYNKALTKGADEVLIFFHWGLEYERLPNSIQKKLANFCHQLGIRIVIGSHPHVIQPMEADVDSIGKIERIRVYSLGNFISNQRKQYTDGGAMFGFELCKKQGKIEISNSSYILTWVHVKLRRDGKKYQIVPVKMFENKEGYFSNEEKMQFDQFVKDSRELMELNNKNISESR